MKPLIAIVGPTGVGKTRLSIHIAQIFNGVIVNADSRQIYRYMDIGTAKPTSIEQSAVPHYLFSVINPDEDFSIAQYQKLSYQIINDLHGRNKLPLLVGGTGQYVRGVLEGWDIPEIPPDVELRHELEAKANTCEGIDELYSQLKAIDPEAALKIDKHNIRRVIRALEVYRKTGRPISQLQRKSTPPFETIIIGLTTNRRELYRRIDLRVDEMIKVGFIEEVKKLINMGYDRTLPAMSSVGYKQIGMYLNREMSLEDAVQKIKVENHRLVRHQYAWFRLKDNRIKWFDIETDFEPEVFELVANFVKYGN